MQELAPEATVSAFGEEDDWDAAWRGYLRVKAVRAFLSSEEEEAQAQPQADPLCAEATVSAFGEEDDWDAVWRGYLRVKAVRAFLSSDEEEGQPQADPLCAEAVTEAQRSLPGEPSKG